MPLNPAITNLFSSVNKPLQKIVSKGSLIAFKYVGQTNHIIQDPYPLIIVSDIFKDMIRGVNLHYLTLPYVRNLVGQHANNVNFSYAYIKADHYIVGAFRSYKRNGISQLRMLDSSFLKSVLSVVRALNPGEIDQIREQIRMQIQSQMNQPKAQPGMELGQ